MQTGDHADQADNADWADRADRADSADHADSAIFLFAFFNSGLHIFFLLFW